MSAVGIQIHPEFFYDDDAVYAALEIPRTTLARARRTGELRFVRKGQRTLYLGEWVLSWLQAGERQEAANAI